MKINVNGYEIAYQITGEGEDTVVILQGWGTELATYYFRQIPGSAV